MKGAFRGRLTMIMVCLHYVFCLLFIACVSWINAAEKYTSLELATKATSTAPSTTPPKARTAPPSAQTMLGDQSTGHIAVRQGDAGEDQLCWFDRLVFRTCQDCADCCSRRARSGPKNCISGLLNKINSRER